MNTISVQPAVSVESAVVKNKPLQTIVPRIGLLNYAQSSSKDCALR